MQDQNGVLTAMVRNGGLRDAANCEPGHTLVTPIALASVPFGTPPDTTKPKQEQSIYAHA